MPLDILMDASEHLMLEFDLAWAVKRGHQSPLELDPEIQGPAYCRPCQGLGAGRRERRTNMGLADVGQGTMDWQGLFTALKAAGAEYFVHGARQPQATTAALPPARSTTAEGYA